MAVVFDVPCKQMLRFLLEEDELPLQGLHAAGKITEQLWQDPSDHMQVRNLDTCCFRGL